jgi:acyl carrier protein
MTHPTLPSRETVLARVRAALAEQLGEAAGGVDADAPLRDALNSYDSLTATECIYAIEREFGVEVDFTTDDVRHWFSSVATIVQFVLQRLEDALRLESTPGLEDTNGGDTARLEGARGTVA